MEKIHIVRVAMGKHSTLSHLYINTLFACYLLEDRIREKKIAGATCIPEGRYSLGLNTHAGMNARYRSRYPDLHQGMLEIKGIPDFSLVFLHIGNYHRDTAGCPLTGHYWNYVNGDFEVMQSAFAYRSLYPELVQLLRQGPVEVCVENRLKSGSERLWN